MINANVLDALDKEESKSSFYRASLKDIVVYGRVRCLIERPSIVGDGIKETEGNFALVDVYALKCLSTDYFREGTSSSVNRLYFTKGSLIIYVDSSIWVGKDVKVFGKRRGYGVTIRRQASKDATSGITAFAFDAPVREGRRQVYPVVPNSLVELTVEDNEVKNSAEDRLVLILKDRSKISYADELEAIIPFTGVPSYKEIPVAVQETPKPVNNPINSPINSPVGTQVSTTDRGMSKQQLPTQKPIGSQPNGYVSDDTKIDISSIDMHLTFHLDGQPKSEYCDDFRDDIKVNAKNRKDFVYTATKKFESLSNSIGLSPSIYRTLKEKFISNLASYPGRAVGRNIKVGTYVDKFIDGCNLTTDDSESTTKDEMGIQAGIAKLRKEYLVDVSVFEGNSDDEDINKVPVLKSPYSFALNVVGTCTGIGYETLIKNMSYCCNRLTMHPELWFFLLVNCPYYLGLIGTGLKVNDCDVLKYSMGTVFGSDDKDLAEECEKYRSYLVMLDTLDSCCNGKFRADSRSFGNGRNTFVKINDYKCADMSYPQKAMSNMLSCRFPATQDVRDILNLLFDTDISLDDFQKSHILKKKWYSEEYFNALCEIGVVNTLDGFCALENSIEKEFLIYEVFETMGKKPTGITDETIERVISSFERTRGFKLEALQHKGIGICKFRAGVLSGCAGSGKTTTSDCITEVLKTLDSPDTPINIIYCTPTGKACRRLAEVVHTTVKTIHSQFKVGIGGNSYMQDAYYRKPNTGTEDDKKGVNIYILDEMAMCSTDLMYNIAKNISDDDMIYFLGDVKQLPPIGGGCPFKVLMTILPCVELGVSKRAAEGSLVNYNTSLINFVSTPVCRDLMYDGKTFIAKDCADTSISATVKSTFLGFMDGSLNGEAYTEDDIQVITGYQSATKKSSTSVLNPPLQEALRTAAGDEILFYKRAYSNGGNNKPYYKNDRVIYVNRNSYDICRYIYDGNSFVKLHTFGCVNGEMGKLVGVVPSEDVVFSKYGEPVAGEGAYANVSEEELEAILERYEDKKDDLRNDDSSKKKGIYFIVIKVYDSDIRRDVYLFLRGRSTMMGADLCLSGSDLDNLDLAYALTCHKMQGSQSKVVIAVFESTGSPAFMNRNMINTIITRSQGIVCCVGSVLGSDSMLNKGRREVSKTECCDILSVLSDDCAWLDS